MNLNQDMSLFTLITGASLPVLVVMALLLITSMVSWWYIFIKVFTIRRADRDAVSFENAFWIGGDLNLLYEGVTAGRKKVQGMASIFEAGFKEYARLKRQCGMENSDIIEGARRAMRAAYNREMDELDAHLPFLASVGSSAPFIGLFGTVYGIMNSFIGIANTNTTNLAVVAPGIAEALLATAIGLFAAIPAVIFYNYFQVRIAAFGTRADQFGTELVNRISRQLDRGA